MASKETPLNESQIKDAVKYVDINFFKAKDPKEDLAELRQRKVICMYSLTIGYLFRCGYSIPRAVQVAEHMKEQELFPPEPEIASLVED